MDHSEFPELGGGSRISQRGRQPPIHHPELPTGCFVVVFRNKIFVRYFYCYELDVEAKN